MDTKFCQKCGHKLAVNDVFCNYCGAKQHDLNLDQNNMNNTSSYDNPNNLASNNNFNNGYQNFGAPYNNFNNGFQNNGSSYNNRNLNTGEPYNNFNNGAPNNGMPYNNGVSNNGFNNSNQNGQLYANNHSDYIGFGDSVKLFWKNAFSFKGCSSRSEYWYSALFYSIVMILSVVIPFIVYYSTSGNEDIMDFILLMMITTVIFDTIAVISLTVRRLHDANLSGGFYWFTCIPYAGWIVLLIFACLPTSPESVRFGKRDDEMWYNKAYAWVILIIISLTSFVLLLAGAFG